MNIFNYESKFNQMVMVFADMVILNILYLVCCIPIFTIGAAQAGLFTGLRVLLDPEDDNSVAKSFFRGFKSEFRTVSLASGILLLLLTGAFSLLPYTVALMLAGGSKLSVIILCVFIAVVYTVHTICGPFHATFGCTTGQLLRNSLFMLIAYPLRSLASALLVAAPLVILLIWPQVLLAGLILFIALYYSTAYLLIFLMLKKPFKRLKDSFYKAQHGQAEVTSESNSTETNTEEE